MAVGWAQDGAVQEQIDSTVDDEIRRVRQQLGQGTGQPFCEICDAEIPLPRRLAVPGVSLCVACQSAEEQQNTRGGINRRGSKDSQLR